MSAQRGIAQRSALFILLAENLGWPVIADGPSGCRIEVLGCVTTFDSLWFPNALLNTTDPRWSSALVDS